MLILLRKYFFVYVFLCVCLNLSAHGPIHEKIQDVTKRIEKKPYDPNLYVERAGYYKIDRDFDRSFADYQTARNINPNLKTIDFLVAELFYEFDHYYAALASVSSFQKQNLNVAECYLLKAKIFDKLFESDSALHYAEAAYPHHTKPNTHYFITVKNYVLYADKTNYERAKYWLEIAKKRLPYDLVIQEAYVDLAMQFKDYDKAQVLCEEKIPTLKRKEYWEYLLGTVYLQKGESDMAMNYFNKAKSSIDRLPRNHKNTTYIKTLTNNINKSIQKING